MKRWQVMLSALVLIMGGQFWMTPLSEKAYGFSPASSRLAEPPTEALPYVHPVGRRFKNSAELVLSPTSMNFSGKDGVVQPLSQELSVSKKTRSKHSTQWKVSVSSQWLSVSTSSGSTGREIDIVTVSPKINGLEPGTYNGTVSVTPTNPSGPAQTVSVSMVIAPPDPKIGQSPASFSFSGQEGASDPDSQPLTIMNQGGGTLSWTIVESIPWLKTDITSGTATNEKDVVNLKVQIANLQAGTYNGTIQVQGDAATNSPVHIPVTLTLAPKIQTTSVILQWSPNSEADLAGYKVYKGTKSGVYGPPTDVGLATSHSISSLQTGTTYYFSVTAYDTSLNESSFAPEVSISVY